MSVRRHACVSLVCDGCGDTAQEDFTPHFDSENEANKYAMEIEWTIEPGLDGSTHYCEPCSEERRQRRADALVGQNARPFLPELTIPLPGVAE